MAQRLDQKIVLVVRRTRLDDLIARFNTPQQARFYVEHLGADFSDYEVEDQHYKTAVRQVETIITRMGRLQVVERQFVPNFLFGPRDIVIALGQDGLVANVMKYLDGQPIIGVNPDPDRWEGVLLSYHARTVEKGLLKLLLGKADIAQVTMAQATLNTGETLLGVNDLFIGPKTHTSARYTIRIDKKTESQSSSGIIISTGLGSTGWLRSIIAGATGITSGVLGREEIQRHDPAFQWDADRLCFSVREPWPSKNSSAELTFGVINQGASLEVVSAMPEHGVIFSDGVEADFLQFNSGTTAKISIADKKGLLVR